MKRLLLLLVLAISIFAQNPPAWSPSVTYPTNARVVYNGTLYTATQPNVNKVPTANTNIWLYGGIYSQGPGGGGGGTPVTCANLPPLTGDVTSAGCATTAGSIGGSSAAQVHSAELVANAATSANAMNSIVKRASDGSFSAGIGNFTGMTLNAPSGAVFTLQNNGTSKFSITAGNTAYLLAGTAAPMVLGTTADGALFFEQNGVLVWQINVSGQGSSFAPYVDNMYSIGLTGATGNNADSPSYVSAYAFRPVSAKSVINGSTSGTITVTNPFSGSGDRKLIITCQNLTGTATYPFSQAWTYLPGIFAPTSALYSAVTTLTTTSVTITGAGTTGVIILEGF